MTTVYLDFAGVSDVNPYPAQPGFTSRGSSTARVVGFTLQGNAESGNTLWECNTDPGIDSYSAYVQVGDSSTNTKGVAFFNASGNGFMFIARASDLRVFALAAYELSGSALATYSATIAATDIVRVDITQSTGTYVVKHNGSTLNTFVNTTYTSGLVCGLVLRSGTIQNFTLEYDAAAGGATITNIDQLIEGATSTVTFSEDFTPTGLLIFDGDSGIVVSSFTGSGAVWDFECPALTDSVPGPKLGAVVVTATDGVDTTEEFASTYVKTGYTGVVLTSLATGHVGQGFSPALEIGNQIAYDNTKGVVGADGVYVDEPPDAYTGTQTMWDHNVSDFTWRSFIVETIDGEIVSVNGITSRGITSRGISSRNISKRGLS